MPSLQDNGWRVRIQDVAGNTHGAGVLLSNYQVLTCAHVVAAALGTREEVPSGELRIDFTAHELVRGRWRAWVDPRGWIPPSEGDLAILEIAGQPPPTAIPAPLQRCGPPGNREVQLYRFAPETADDVMDARLVGQEQNPNGTWIRLDGPQFAQYRDSFDGAGVFERATGSVIGYLVSASPPGLRQPRMLSMEAAVALLGSRAQFTLGQAPLQPPPDMPVMRGRLTSERWRKAKEDLWVWLTTIFGEVATSDLELLVEQLQASFGPCFSVSASSTGIDFGYVRILLNACAEQTGATYELYSHLLQWFREGRLPGLSEADLTELRWLVRQIDPEPELISTDLRRRLYDLIVGLSFGTAAEAYQASSPVGLPVPAYASDPVTMARELESQNKERGGLPPVVRFAEELAKRESRNLCETLRRWVDDYGDMYPSLLPQIDEYRYTPSPPMGRPVLVLEIDHDHPDSGRFKSVATLHHSEALSKSRPVRRTRGIRLHVPDVAQDMAALFHMTDVLLSCIRQPPSSRSPVVEFAVPQSMLDYEFDQWPVGAVLPRALGTDRPVIVRMLGRSGSHAAHREKWYWLLARGHRVDPAAVLWLWQLSAPGSLTQILSGLTPVCAAFGMPARPQDAMETDDFSVAIRSGMPIMLWPRMESNRVAYQELRRMLTQNCLLDLPDQIRDWRASIANRQPEWLGKHITLMYDDPMRSTEPASGDGDAERGHE